MNKYSTKRLVRHPENRMLFTKKTAIRFWVALLFTFSIFGANAQQYYNGTSGTSYNAFPLNSTSNDVQWIYAPGTLNSAGSTGIPAGAGNITKIYFRLGTTVGAVTYTNFTIKLSQNMGTASVYPSTAFNTGMTTCFGPATYTMVSPVALGWYGVTLTTPFYYNPALSLQFELACSAGTGNQVAQVSGTGNQRVWGTYGSTGGSGGAGLVDFGMDVSASSTNDAGVMSIDSPYTFCSTGTYPVKATIKNYGRNQIYGVSVNWSVAGTTQTPITYSTLLDTSGGSGSSSAQVNLGSYAFTSTPVDIKAWTSYPNSVADTVRINDSAFAFGKQPSFPGGTYTINSSSPTSGTNFASFAAAISAMTTAGICGPVVFNVAAGTYTQTSPIIIPAIVGVSRTNTITFDGGNGNAASRIVTGSIATSALIFINCNYVTWRNMTVSNTYTTNCAGIALCGSIIKPTINNCIITLPVYSSTSYCIATMGGPSGYSAGASSVDSLRIDSNVLNGGYFGMYIYGYSTTAGAFGFNRDFKIRNNTLNNQYYYGIQLYAIQNGFDLMYNTLNLGSTAYYGLYMYYCYNHNAGNAPHRIIGNKIMNFAYNYMYYFSSTINNPTIVYNNMFGGSTQATTNYGLYCSNATYAGYYQIYHNTFNLNNGTGTVYGLYYSNTTGGDALIKNNIFSITSTGATSGYPLYCSSSPATSSVNYNVYYNASNTNLVYRNAITYISSTFLTNIAGGDTAYNVNPNFINSALNLHVVDACSGKPGASYLLTTVPTDIDGTTRTVPIIGAHEAASSANDMTASIVISPVAPVNSGTATVAVRFKNVGSTPVYTFTANYRLNGGTPVTQAWGGTLAPCADTLITFTTTCTLSTNNNFKFYSSSPNGTVDGNRNNDTITTTLLAAMAGGTYTINSSVATGGTNYNTFAAATSAMAAGINGTITFNVAAGTYNEQVIIPNCPGMSATNTVTFEGGNGNASTRIISWSGSSVPALLFYNCKYVKVRNITITNPFAGSCQGVAFVATAAGLNVGNTLNNCIVTLPNAGTSTSYGITSTGIASGYGAGVNTVDSLRLDSNNISGSYYGIYLYGNSTTAGTWGYNRDFKIRWNNINNIYYYAMYLYYIQSGIDVIGNNINNLSAAAGYYGLYMYYCQNHVSTNAAHRISGNSFSSMAYNYVYYTSATATNPTQITNNMVFNTKNYSTNYGFYVYNGSGNTGDFLIYNNSIYLSSGTSTAYGLYYYNSVGGSATYIKNNIFGLSSGSLSTGYPLYCSTNPPTSAVNYNIYTNAAGAYLVYRNSLSYISSTYLTNIAGGDTSYNMNPSFVNSTTNLRLTSPCSPRAVNTGLTSVTGVTLDIDGNTRAASPQIGCSEVSSYANDMSVVTLLSPSYPIALGTQTVSARYQNFGSNTIYTFTAGYKVNSGTPVTQTIAPSTALNTCDTISVTFTTPFTLSAQSTLKVYSASPGGSTDNNTLNDTITAIVAPPMGGTYTIGTSPSDFTTFGAAISALQTLGVGAPVTFNVKSATYNEYIDFSTAPIIGLTASNPITFKSVAGVADSVVLSPSANAFVVKFQNTSFISFKNMTLNQPTLGNNGIVFAGSTSSFDTIYNCKVTLQIGSTTAYIVTSNGAYINNIVFRKNIFTGGYYGLYLYNSAAPYVGKNCIIDSNTIQSVYYYSIYCYYNSENFKVRNNTFTLNGGSGVGYIYFYYPDSAYEFSNNITNVASTTTSVYYYVAYYAQGNAANHAIVHHNKINLATTSTSVISYLGYYSQFTDVYNNDLNLGSGYVYSGGNNYTRLYNNTIASAGATYTLYLYAGYTGTELRNNILSNTAGVTPLTLSGTLGTTELLDYNLYYSTGANQVSTYTLAAWKALAANSSVARDRNSLSYRPPYTSTLSLVPNPLDSAVWAINGRAQFLPMITSDVNYTTRPTVPFGSGYNGVPDIGAYEVTPNAATLAPLATATPTVPVANSSQWFLFAGDTLARVDYATSYPVPSAIGLRHYAGVRPPQSGTAALDYMAAYWDMTVSGTYLYNLTQYYKKPWIGTNASEVGMFLSKKTPTTAWSIATYYGATTVDTFNCWLTTNALTSFGYFSATDILAPLPVSLTHFDATLSANDALLNWSTASENNSSLFDIERSLNGSNFVSIAKVKASGNTNEMTNYHFDDVNAASLFTQSNTIYYRLKMVDKDGSFTYSDIAMVNRKLNALGTVNVYPNPFNNELNITMNSLKDATAKIEVVDIQGRIVLTKSANVFKGDNKITVSELSNLNSGIYFVNMVVNGEMIHAKVIKN